MSSETSSSKINLTDCLSFDLSSESSSFISEIKLQKYSNKLIEIQTMIEDHQKSLMDLNEKAYK